MLPIPTTLGSVVLGGAGSQRQTPLAAGTVKEPLNLKLKCCLFTVNTPAATEWSFPTTN